MNQKEILLGGKKLNYNQAARQTGLSVYNMKKIINHISSKMSVDLRTFDFKPYLSEQGLQEVAQRTKGTKYTLNGKKLTKPEIAKETGQSYYQVTTAIKTAGVSKGETVDHLFKDKEANIASRKQAEKDRAALKAIERAGYMFMGERVTVDDLCSILNKPKTAVVARLNKHFPINERLSRYLRNDKTTADITSIFCWETVKPHKTGVHYFGVFDQKPLYEVDGTPMAVDEVVKTTGLSKSCFYTSLSKDLKIEPTMGFCA